MVGSEDHNRDRAIGEGDSTRLDLVNELAAERERLQYQLDFTRAITDSLAEGVIIYDESRIVTYANDAALRMVGLDADNMIGTTLADLAATDTDLEAIAPLGSSGVSTRNVEFAMRRPDGSTIVTLSSASPIWREGKVLAHVLAVRDVTELKQAEATIRQMNRELEARVEERTTQLQQTNKELETFSYSVSHDLRAPIRHIAGFTELLEKRVAGTLDATSIRYLKAVSDAAAYAGTLVDNLLSLSRLGRAKLRYSKIDMTRLVRDVLQGVEPDLAGRKVEFLLQELPPVHADMALLRILMENLVSNAVKYTAPRETARVEIGGGESDREVEFWVKDNGVGFDMKYSGKLFGVFQRLHRAEEFEGTGIGLATVQRILARHGGHIEAYSKPEEGATFKFALPKNPPRIL